MSEKFNLYKRISDEIDSVYEHAKEAYPDQLWRFDIQKLYWQSIYKAHQEGKKLIMISQNGPIELVYAFGAVPFVIESTAPRISGMKDLPAELIDHAEKYIDSDVCAFNKMDIGIVFSGVYGDKPDALIYTQTPCDSTRTVYPPMEEKLGIPSYAIDTPFVKDGRGRKYIADQLYGVIELLERVTGNKLDMDKVREAIGYSNQASVLLDKIAELKKHVPCPYSSAYTAMTGLCSSVVGSKGLVEFLENYYEFGRKNVENGVGGIKEEKHRLMLLQNMVYTSGGLLKWMEKNYGALTVISSFSVRFLSYIEDTSTLDSIFMGLAKRMMEIPMIHAASGPAEEWLKILDEVVEDYHIDCAIFAGHVGCKHTWAVSKMIKDVVREKYGIPVLTVDMDTIDSRYKNPDETKAAVAEYFAMLDADKEA